MNVKRKRTAILAIKTLPYNYRAAFSTCGLFVYTNNETYSLKSNRNDKFENFFMEIFIPLGGFTTNLLRRDIWLGDLTQALWICRPTHRIVQKEIVHSCVYLHIRYRINNVVLSRSNFHIETRQGDE